MPISEFNSYGSRRGNHEVMVRGTFANIRLKNKLAPGTEGGVTRHLPDGEAMSIFDASEQYRDEGVPLIVLAGKEYGSGSSRDWAAKGPKLLGIRAVIAESYERIHRSNLVGMGILRSSSAPATASRHLGLTGEETFAIEGLAAGLADGFQGGREVTVVATKPDGDRTSVHRDGPDRHAPGNPLLSARWDPPVRAPAVARGQGRGPGRRRALDRGRRPDRQRPDLIAGRSIRPGRILGRRRLRAGRRLPAWIEAAVFG